MRDLTNIISGAVVAVLLLSLTPVSAVPTVGVESFATMNGWTNAPYVFGGATNVSVGSIGAQTAVRIMFPSQGSPSPQDVAVYATSASSSGNFVGTYVDGQLGVRFNFYADDFTTASNTVAFFFHSTNGSGRTWQYALSGPAVIDAWSTYSVPMGWGTGAGWSAVGNPGQAAFIADLQFVDQLGILVARSANIGAQNYGLDDFELWVPEPSTYAMLAFAFLTLGLTLRRKRLAPVYLARR